MPRRASAEGTFRTQRDVDQLTASPREYVFDSDCAGLSIRFQSGRRTWVAHYQAGAKRRRVSLGTVAGIKLAKARELASTIVREAKDDKDVLDERKRAKAKAEDTLRKLVNAYLAEKAKPERRPRTYVETERYLTRTLAPLLDTPIAGLTGDAIRARLRAVAKEKGGVTGNRCRAALSAAIAWGMRQGVAGGVTRNPVIDAPRPMETEPERTRKLDDMELVAIWHAAEGLGDFGAICRLLIVLGARRQEIGGMAWRELNLEEGTWLLPVDRCKSKRELLLPLPRPAIAIIAARPRGAGDRCVFGRGAGGFSAWSASKARMDLAIARAAAQQRLQRSLENGEMPEPGDFLPAWHLHDLRRTAASGMGRIGVLPAVISAVLNHSRRETHGITAIYNTYDYLPEKAAALQRWADHVEMLLGRGERKVIPLRA